jgi:two-component system, NtrC family, response regulator GlrR
MTFHEQRTQSIVPLYRSVHPVAALRSSSGVMYPLGPAQSRWSVGSHPGCDVILEDRWVSAQHCVLERVAHGALVVRDRGSRNGTFLDGHAVEGAMVTIGSRLLLGKTTLVAIGESEGASESAWASLRGADPAFVQALDCANKAAVTECSVLVVGETGTGKDLLARAIHERSARAPGPFVAVNCGAIPRELMASELFGHERGAFTGASSERDGYFAEATGGTLFLDELGELPLELQPHLLRVLETRRVRRVGGATERPVDVRVIAATNRIEGLGTEASRLRLDLFHRVAAVVIALPPLRERKDDLRALVAHFMEGHDGRSRRVSDDAWAAMEAYEWPGNARELRHAVIRAMTLGDELLEAKDFFPDINVRRALGARRTSASGEPLAAYQTPVYEEMLRSLTTHGSIRRAAAAIGMPKSTFADRAHLWGLVPRRAGAKQK